VKQEPVDDALDWRPEKKCRVFMDAVVVPTLASILSKPPKFDTDQCSREEMEKTLGKLRNVCFSTSLRILSMLNFL